MTDWIEHNGGPQPVDDGVWVGVRYLDIPFDINLAQWVDWSFTTRYRILNQHLIDAARLEGIRLGLEAAVEEADYFDESVGAGLRIAKRRLLAETIAKEADQ